MFLYWGRRGALSRFSLDLARAAQAAPEIQFTLSVSRQNERFSEFSELGESVFPINTFSSTAGALVQTWRIPGIRRLLLQRLVADQTEVVINLMPHIWSPLVTPAIRKAGVRFVTIVHDGMPHPGDLTGLLNRWIDQEIKDADLVLTLSETTAGRLAAFGRVPRSRLFTLLHPDLVLGPRSQAPEHAGQPLKILFLGRILPYKGLNLLLDAMELLRDEGVRVQLGVFGEGNIGDAMVRLHSLGAEVVNRWLSEEEIGSALARYHIVALPHIEASQSGVVAAAFGSGLPVVATPVGGLIEQVRDGINGVVAQSADAPALAEAIKRLSVDPQLYFSLRRQIEATREERSMSRFLHDLVSHAVHAGHRE